MQVFSLTCIVQFDQKSTAVHICNTIIFYIYQHLKGIKEGKLIQYIYTWFIEVYKYSGKLTVPGR